MGTLYYLPLISQDTWDREQLPNDSILIEEISAKSPASVSIRIGWTRLRKGSSPIVISMLT